MTVVQQSTAQTQPGGGSTGSDGPTGGPDGPVGSSDGASPEARPEARLSDEKWIAKVVDTRIRSLQSSYLDDRSGAVAALARIRRGAGRAAGTVPDLWGVIGAEGLYERPWREADAVRAENAVHLAVTLWALHQQGHHDGNMHVSGGPGLGGAVRRLMPDGEIQDRIRKRFVRAATASSIDTLAVRLRELVLLMRGEDIALDYGRLAGQLYIWQRPGGRAEVHRLWGRSFHAYRKPEREEQPGQDQ
ncbi:type I-E CRISPR-associated protein Cse2/CasB [Streptomyces nitrosporeus]|uniref:type I-E CRISPR-associated protein Cse2/CasB n=1 Tax=Streptomyces nitrosporeus TaxID=28894 RepID=UPI00399FFF00